ncbi:hypothetical protein ACI514_16735 [Pseudomonas sp. M20]|uniref:hypothetical protein n=1 Tax=Pseudomonas sp. M20 TaxID=3379129 RepID=UPI003863255A
MPSTPALTDIPSSAEDTDALSFMASNPAFLSSDDAATGLHNLLKTPLSAELHGFILKNTEGRFFCAQRVDTNPVSGELRSEVTTLLRTTLVVTVGGLGELIVPSGFTIEASFHARPAQARGVDESTSEWAQRNRFFTIADLSAVMNSHRKYSKCYLSAYNGGLLCYASTNLPFEQELAPRLSRRPQSGPQLFESLLARGAIPSSLWILLVLAAGQVNVVVTGDLWRRRGPLKASWRSDVLEAKPPITQMPIFGPICRNAGEVALYLREKLSVPPPASPRVGFILKHNASDFLVVTDPVSIPYASFDRAALFPKDQHGNPLIPRGFRVHGIYHSTPQLAAERQPPRGMDLYRNFFTPEDLKVGLDHMIAAPNQRIFMVTPDGAVLRFAKPIIPKVRELKANLEQGLKQKIIDGDMPPQGFVDKVADAGILSVLLASQTWPDLGKITAASTVDVTGVETSQ